MVAVVSVVVALLTSLVAPALLKPLLSRFGVLDVPNARSSHAVPVIRGMGLSPMLAILLGLLIALMSPIAREDFPLIVIIALVAAAAGLLGWIEDSRGIPVAIRAGAQLVLGVAGVGALAVFTGMSWWMVPLLALAVAGYVNVTNFMDGINGISGLHGAVSGGVYAVLGSITGEFWMVPVGLVIAVAFLGFLPWNLIRGGMFLGDVGSYLLGGSLAIVAVAAIARGVPPLGVIGPLAIYLVDAGTTLVRRVLLRERWYEAHRSHIYQQLTDAGLAHIQVSVIVTVFGIASSAAGLVVVAAPGLWLVSACLLLVVGAAYFMLGRIVSAQRGRRADLLAGGHQA